ncbi:hypothetical protein GCM10010840_08630 [Deinococcus aerolatus]|uniref:Uncharacterized protein n=1 Tax=Deinococcus aerolatus TaxID=522487 RepID=A0ABQ2G354_9DEIO|nr:hypothetical protein [Deinococcus aerolatus]GGL72808.1 hypothetical protein GCM10010840_08630 [Deinococcus aerolatus]
MPLSLLAAPHLTRAAVVRCGAQTWTRQGAETRKDFARRVQLSLIDCAEGRIMEADEAADVPAGPTRLVSDQPQRALSPGDTVICFQPGVTQPMGVAVHGLRGLLDTLQANPLASRTGAPHSGSILSRLPQAPCPHP